MRNKSWSLDPRKPGLAGIILLSTLVGSCTTTVYINFSGEINARTKAETHGKAQEQEVVQEDGKVASEKPD
jgi:hypothetical protein